MVNADQIIVLDKGRIVAQGRHAELLKSSPIYLQIYHSQLIADTEAAGAGVAMPATQQQQRTISS